MKKPTDSLVEGVRCAPSPGDGWQRLGLSKTEPVRTGENLDGIKFMTGGPMDSCHEGSVTVDNFEMTLNGYINEGGYIPAVGH